MAEPARADSTAAPGGAAGPDWESLAGEIQRCVACPLHAGRTHVVIYRGGEHPRIVFVGEAPGKDEDRSGIPFVGRAGRALDRAIDAIGARPSEVGILNLIKCRPPGNRFDRLAEATCRPFLDRQLDLLRPERVVTLGRYALRALAPSAPAILIAAGHPQVGARGPVFPLIHPSAPMHAPGLRTRWEQDLGLLRAWLASPLPRDMGSPIE